MALNLISPFSLPSAHRFRFSLPPGNNSNSSTLLYFLLGAETASSKFHRNFSANLRSFNSKASLSGSENTLAEDTNSELSENDELIRRVLAVKDAAEALEVIAEMTERSGGVVSCSDCCLIISAALDRNNADLALSVFSAMRSSFDPAVGEKNFFADRWKWSRPDVNTYTLLAQGLAASLRVSDALRIIANVCRVGVSPGEEVPFGKVVRCPTCMIAVAVAQPQHGIQACTQKTL